MSRILYVEDECVLQLDGEAWLRAAGHDVVLASDGEAATALLREGNAWFDGLISDIDLPGAIQGWQIAAVGRQINADLPVIYVTGQTLDDFKLMGVADSIMAPKPFEWRCLLASLSGLITAAKLYAPGGPSLQPSSR